MRTYYEIEETDAYLTACELLLRQCGAWAETNGLVISLPLAGTLHAGAVRRHGPCRAGGALLRTWGAVFQSNESRRMICCHQGIKNIMIRCHEDHGHP